MKTEHSIAQLCAAFEVTRSGYHAWQTAPASARARADAALLEQIRPLHRHHRGRYGAPRFRAALARRGQRHGTKRIGRLLGGAGLRGRTRVARPSPVLASGLLHSLPIPSLPSRRGRVA